DAGATPPPPADAGVTTVPPTCDSTKTPSQDPCVVIEALGVFVAPSASDAGASVADGTRSRPFAKIQDAIAAAKDQKKRVYACAADYAEQVTLADGVSMFGDLDCSTWAVVPGHANVKAPASPAITANAITTATRVEAFDFTAPDGTAAAPTSIGLVATSANALTFAQSTIKAGKGASGADGVAAVQLANGTVNGANAMGDHTPIASLPLCSTMPATINTCVGAPGYQGGTGGAGGWGGHWVVNHERSIPTAYSPPSTTMCTVLRPCVCTNSSGGSQPASATTAQGGQYVIGSATASVAVAGQAGADGHDGTTGVAMLSADSGLRFVPGDATGGTDGQPGQGGGGGAGIPTNPADLADGAEIIGATGAGGGAGGCPGLAGSAGKGGGASIAVLTDSALTLDTCIVQSSDGGNGGSGSFPSNPTAGGSPGTAALNVPYENGAAGGAGGHAGVGGNGAGGPSIGIAAHGASPKLVSTTPAVGAQGHGVAARTSGSSTIATSADGQGGAVVTF
ncbi:MAG TPA: hypothetical protein VF407_19130, partial [Polyangiaceae bacterium]